MLYGSVTAAAAGDAEAQQQQLLSDDLLPDLSTRKTGTRRPMAVAGIAAALALTMVAAASREATVRSRAHAAAALAAQQAQGDDDEVSIHVSVATSFYVAGGKMSKAGTTAGNASLWYISAEGDGATSELVSTHTGGIEACAVYGDEIYYTSTINGVYKVKRTGEDTELLRQTGDDEGGKPRAIVVDSSSDVLYYNLFKSDSVRRMTTKGRGAWEVEVGFCVSHVA